MSTTKNRPMMVPLVRTPKEQPMHPAVEAAILKIQQHAKENACAACQTFLTSVANDLRNAKP